MLVFQPVHRITSREASRTDGRQAAAARDATTIRVVDGRSRSKGPRPSASAACWAAPAPLLRPKLFEISPLDLLGIAREAVIVGIPRNRLLHPDVNDGRYRRRIIERCDLDSLGLREVLAPREKMRPTLAAELPEDPCSTIAEHRVALRFARQQCDCVRWHQGASRIGRRVKLLAGPTVAEHR
jgi:hypothetical protein